MDKLKFYIVPKSYIDYLQNCETKARGFSRVPNLDYGNERKQKFVCGVVLNINNINYFAPITSYKIQKADNFLILNSNRNKVLSSLRFNYMFPVPKEILNIYSFDTISDTKYRTLVQQEYKYCVKNQEHIRELAYRTYKRVLLGKDKGLVHNSCDFLLLEKKCQEYIQVHIQTIHSSLNQNTENDFNKSSAPLPRDTIKKNAKTISEKYSEQQVTLKNNNSNNYYYLKVSCNEALYLKNQGIAFEGTIQKNKLNVIRINIKDRDQAENMLLYIRNNNIKK